MDVVRRCPGYGAVLLEIHHVDVARSSKLESGQRVDCRHTSKISAPTRGFAGGFGLLLKIQQYHPYLRVRIELTLFKKVRSFCRSVPAIEYFWEPVK